jgi:hypothetical protein
VPGGPSAVEQRLNVCLKALGKFRVHEASHSAMSSTHFGKGFDRDACALLGLLLGVGVKEALSRSTS